MIGEQYPAAFQGFANHMNADAYHLAKQAVVESGNFPAQFEIEFACKPLGRRANERQQDKARNYCWCTEGVHERPYDSEVFLPFSGRP